MAVSGSLGLGRVCRGVVQFVPRLGLGPHHSRLPGNPLTFIVKSAPYSNTYSRTGFICQRQFFTNWSPVCQSSVPKEQVNSGSTVTGRSPSTEDDKSRTTPPKEAESAAEDDEEEPIIPTTDEKGQPLSNWSRMKIMMKTYGYVIIPVHWVIAPVWFGAFYYTIKMGVDIGPLLTAIGVSDHHVESLRNSSASTALMAYALYKIFTPLRYTVTLGATEMTIRRLRKMGYIHPHPPKEKTYRDSFKETITEVRDKLKDR